MRNREKTKMELISRLLKRQIDNFYSSKLGGKFPSFTQGHPPSLYSGPAMAFPPFPAGKNPPEWRKENSKNSSMTSSLLPPVPPPPPDRSETFQDWWDLIRDPRLKKTVLNEKVGRPLTSGFHFLGRERHLPACSLAAVLLAAGVFLHRPLKINNNLGNHQMLFPPSNPPFDGDGRI